MIAPPGRRPALTLVLGLGASLMAAGCAPRLDVRTVVDPAFDPRDRRTFRLAGAVIMAHGAPAANILLQRLVDEALRVQLVAKGFTQITATGDRTDLLVRYVADEPTGVLVVGVYDARRDNLVWQVSCHARGQRLSDPWVVGRAVAKALGRYPP